MAYRKDVTMSDVALLANVSIASVSSVINQSRYVSPEIQSRVWEAVEKSGYVVPKTRKKSSMQLGFFAIVLPTLDINFQIKILQFVKKYLNDFNVKMQIYLSDYSASLERRIISELNKDKKCLGYILFTSRDKIFNYEVALIKQKPHVIIKDGLFDIKIVNSIKVNTQDMVEIAVEELRKNGHVRIGLITKKNKNQNKNSREIGFYKAISKLNFSLDDKYVLTYNEDTDWNEIIPKFIYENKLTAIIMAEFTDKNKLLHAIKRSTYACPSDISLIMLGDEDWFEHVEPSISCVTIHLEQMINLCKLYLDKALNGIKEVKGFHKNKIKQNNNTKKIPEQDIVDNTYINRNSTQMIVSGPFGEKAFSPSDLVFSYADEKKLKSSRYRAAISFHYGRQSAWFIHHERGIRQALRSHNIDVGSIYNADFDPQKQISQLYKIMNHKPDVLISIPTNDEILSPIYKALSKVTKLVFISNVPLEIELNDYYSCVSVNERESATNIARYMQKYYGERNVNIGLLQHGEMFYGTQLRDSVVEQILTKGKSNIHISVVETFGKLENCYDTVKKMLIKHPYLDGLYVSWEAAALDAIKVLDEMGLYDVDIFTCDLDVEIATYMAENRHVRAISSQRPFEQGIAIGNAAAKALLGESKYKYIGVPAYLIDRDNLYTSWRNIFHSDLPFELRRNI